MLLSSFPIPVPIPITARLQPVPVPIPFQHRKVKGTGTPVDREVLYLIDGGLYQEPRFGDDDDVYYPKGRRPREDEEGEESYEKQRQRPGKGG